MWATGWRLALGWSVGEARVLAPFALAGGGAVLLLARMLPALQTAAHRRTVHVRRGDARPGGGHARGQRGHRLTAHARSSGRSFLEAHGGAMGQALYGVRTDWCKAWAWTSLWSFLFVVGVDAVDGRLAGGDAARDRQRRGGQQPRAESEGKRARRAPGGGT